jgi:hypothetical protein
VQQRVPALPGWRHRLPCKCNALPVSCFAACLLLPSMQIWDDWRGAALRDVIAAEAQRNPLDGRDYDPQVRSLQLLAVTLLIKLSLTPSLLFPQDVARWAGLLELTYLAQASHRNFVVFTAQTSPSSTTGRNQAFIVPDGVRVGAVGHESGRSHMHTGTIQAQRAHRSLTSCFLHVMQKSRCIRWP